MTDEKRDKKHETILPIGPFHPLLKEPEYFKVHVDGEKVTDFDFRLGFNHRGIEKIVESKTYSMATTLLGKVCGICNQAHSLAFSIGVEKINKITVPKRGKYIRTITFELERIQSHLLWLGVMAEAIGFETVFMHSWRERERTNYLFELMTGNRIAKEMSVVGGSKWDLDEKTGKKVLSELPNLVKFANNMERVFTKDKLVHKRLKEVGVLSKEEAKHFDVVGPVARASSLDFDIRKNSPYEVYKDFEFNVIVGDGADCLERTLVRIREIKESAEIIRQCIELLPGGEHRLKFFKSAEGKTTSRVEAPRGENAHFMVTGEMNPVRLKIRAPTYANIPPLKTMLLNQKIADVPPIIISIDPCFSCTDRIAVYKKGELVKRV